MRRDTARQIESAAAALDLALDEDQLDRLAIHLELLAKWNSVYNLTAIRDPEAMLQQHLVDSLTVVAPVRRWLQASTPGQRLLDVGSGAGFPGLPLAIALPELRVTCVDAVGKKISFITQVIAEAAIANADAVQLRVEQLPRLDCTVITSRAFAALRDFVALTRKHLRADGVWVAMKGKVPADEIAGLPDDVEMFHVEQLALPGSAAERCLVWMRPRP